MLMEIKAACVWSVYLDLVSNARIRCLRLLSRSLLNSLLVGKLTVNSISLKLCRLLYYLLLSTL